MSWLISRELSNKYILVNIVDTKFSENLSQICDINNFLLISFTLKFSCWLGIRAEYNFISQKFWANNRKNLFIWGMEISSNSS